MTYEKTLEYLISEGEKIFGKTPHLLSIQEYTNALAKWDALLYSSGWTRWEYYEALSRKKTRK